MKTKKKKSSDLRYRLLKSAKEIILKEGIKKLTMRALASQVGVSRAAPYLHFENKDAILSTIAEEGFKDLTHTYRKINNDQSLGADKKLQQVGLAYINSAIDNPGVFTLMFSKEITKNKFSNKLVSIASETFTEFMNAVKAFQLEYNLTNLGFTSLVNYFWSTVHGLADLLINDQIHVTGEKSGYPTLLCVEDSKSDDEILSKMEFSELVLKNAIDTISNRLD